MIVAPARKVETGLRRALHGLWWLVACLVIGYALLVSTVRLALPAADRYQERINGWLTESFDVAVEVDGITGEWRGISPVLRARSLSLGGTGGQAAIVAEHIHLEPDLLWSLLRRQLVWKSLSLRELSLQLTETAAGRWQVDGFNGQGEGNLSGALDMLFHSDRVLLDHISLGLQFYSGSVTRIEATAVRLENAGAFRRLAGAVRLGDMREVSRFVFEGVGRPDDWEHFSGHGFVALNELHFSGELSGLAQQWFPDLANRLGEFHPNIHLDTWFEIQSGGVRFQSQLRADRIPLDWVDDIPDAREVRADLIGALEPGKHWWINVQNLTFQWRDLDMTPLNLRFRQELGARWTDFSLALEHLDLADTTTFLLESRFLPESAASVIAALSPRGRIHRLWADFKMEDDVPHVAMRGNLRDVDIDAWRDAPAARGVSGYFEAGLDHGMVEVASDTLALWYPQAYEEFMPYGRTRGRVRWHWLREASRVQVDAGPIAVDDEGGQGRVWLDLSLPIAQPGKSADMTLMVQMHNSHSRYRDRYIPKVLPPNLRHWLNTAIGDAHIPRVDFIWRGPFAGEQHRTVQLALALREGELTFAPAWPALQDIDAALYLNNTDLYVAGSRAHMMGIAAHDIAVTLSGANRGDPVIGVEADVEGRVGDALALLQSSPVAPSLTFLEHWEADGEVSGTLDLSLPLQRLTSDGRHRVATHITQGTLRSPVLKLDFEDIDGPLEYDSASGLQSDALTGRLWGHPLQASIRTGSGRTELAMSGPMDMGDLADAWWPGQDIIAGQSNLEALLSIEHSAVNESRLEVSSALYGTTLALPAPLGKHADDKVDLALTIGLPRIDGQWQVEWTYDNTLDGKLAFNGDVLDRGAVSLSGGPVELPSHRAMLLTVAADTLDWQAWWQRYQELDIEAGTQKWTQALPIALDVRLDHLDTDWLTFEELALRGGGDRNGWRFDLTSAQAAGEIHWRPAQTQPTERIKLDLEHLKLPPAAAIAETAGPVSIDPRQFPSLIFSVAELSFGERVIGPLGFTLRSSDEGARFANLRGDFQGLAVAAGDPELDAELVWSFDGSRHHTALSGQFMAEDLENVLVGLGEEPVLESRRSVFNVAWRWPGSPWEARVTTLSGLLNFELEDGLFRRTSGGTDAALRVVGLFNFANWVRRLRLDFSDFFTEGVSFDRVTGGVRFLEGVLVIDHPIDARLPAGQMRMTGNVDLLQETLDLRMVTTLPVSTNLPWIAALVGGLPAAAGVYLTSKIFSAQVDRLSSIGHHIHGAWDDPTVEVDRIFSDGRD